MIQEVSSIRHQTSDLALVLVVMTAMRYLCNGGWRSAFNAGCVSAPSHEKSGAQISLAPPNFPSHPNIRSAIAISPPKLKGLKSITEKILYYSGFRQHLASANRRTCEQPRCPWPRSPLLTLLLNITDLTSHRHTFDTESDYL